MRLLILFLLALEVEAAPVVYYVATNGNDSANGTSTNTPFLTIGKAASVVAAGDSVNIGQGIFNEFVTNTASGVTFSGTRGGGGEWLTIIDPSFPMTNWTLAAEGSNGVYKTTGLSNPIVEMTIGASRRRCAFVYTPGDITAFIGSVWTNSGITSGIQFLSTPSSLSLGNAHGMVTNVWDVLGACFASTGSVCYVRFKNGDDPNTMDIRGMDNDNLDTGGNLITKNVVSFEAFSGISNVVWQDVWVRGAPGGFHMRYTANHNTIISNKVTGCFTGIQLYTSTTTTGASANQILYNVRDGNRYGLNGAGAWEGDTNITGLDKEMAYEFSKYLEGKGGGYDNAVEFYYIGHSNVLSGNILTNDWANGMVLTGNPTNPAQGLIISSNVFATHPSTGIVWQWGLFDAHIFDNTFTDCNGSLRSTEWRSGFQETNRTVYVYRNTSWLPPLVGEHVYGFFPTSGQNFWPTTWVYHNSFSGGRDAFNTSTTGPVNGFLKNWHIINNIASGCWSWWFWQPGYDTNAAYVGDFAYNLIQTNANSVPVIPYSVAWFGTNNIPIATNAWTSTGLGMSFALPTGSPAIDSAIDTTTSFTLSDPGGTNTFSALPQDSTVKVGSAWDIGALEFTPPAARANSVHVINAFFK